MARTSTKSRKAADADFEAMMAAASDERARFNAAVAAGASVQIKTFCGWYQVEYVTTDHWYVTRPCRGGEQRSWAGCNDGQWATMLAQAGVARNARWAK